MSTAARMLPYAVRYLISAFPSVYMPYARRHYAHSGVAVVDRDTQLVIEGFGRSGSTFAVDAFQLAQDRSVSIAHHTHAAAQVIAAAKRGLPTLLLVRDPAGAVLSHMTRRAIGPWFPLMAWTLYHRRLVPYRDRLVIGNTDRLSTDIGLFFERVNRKFATEFRIFEPTEENVARIFEGIDRRNRERYGGAAVSLARPTVEREDRKDQLRHLLESPRLSSALARADELYKLLLPTGQIGRRTAGGEE